MTVAPPSAPPRLERGAPFSGLIQVAGVHDLAEALALRAAGVHAMGLPLRLPVNAEDLTEPEAAQLVAEVERLPAPPLLPVGITTLPTGPRRRSSAACWACAACNCTARWRPPNWPGCGASFRTCS